MHDVFYVEISPDTSVDESGTSGKFDASEAILRPDIVDATPDGAPVEAHPVRPQDRIDLQAGGTQSAHALLGEESADDAVGGAIDEFSGGAIDAVATRDLLEVVDEPPALPVTTVAPQQRVAFSGLAVEAMYPEDEIDEASIPHSLPGGGATTAEQNEDSDRASTEGDGGGEAHGGIDRAEHGESGDGSFSPELVRQLGEAVADLEHRYETGEALGRPATAIQAFEVEFTLTIGTGSAATTDPEQFRGHSWDEIEQNRHELMEGRAHIVDEIERLVPQGDDYVREREEERKAIWLDNIPSLSLQELAMHEIHARLSRPSLRPKVSLIDDGWTVDLLPENTLEYRFGTAAHGDGWYDGEDTFEMRTQPGPPTVAIHRLRTALETAQDVAAKYGLQLNYHGDQTHFSIWTEDESGNMVPMSTLATSDGQRVMRNVVGGILQAVPDASGAIPHPQLLPFTSDYILLVANMARVSTGLRVLRDQVELRVPMGEEGSPELTTLAMLSGPAYGQLHPEVVARHTSVVERPLFEPDTAFERQVDHHLLRAMQHSTIDSHDGHLEIDTDYAYIRGDRILRILTGDDEFTLGEVLPRGLFTKMVQEVMRTISVDESGAIHYNADMLDAVFASYVWTQRYVDNHAARTLQRMPIIHYGGMVTTIEGSVPLRTASSLVLHDDLNRFVMSAVFRENVDSELLEGVRAARASAYSHEQAIVDRILFYVIPAYQYDDRVPPEEQAEIWHRQILILLDNDPELRREHLLQLLRTSLAEEIARPKEYPGIRPGFDQLAEAQRRLLQRLENL